MVRISLPIRDMNFNTQNLIREEFNRITAESELGVFIFEGYLYPHSHIEYIGVSVGLNYSLENFSLFIPLETYRVADEYEDDDDYMEYHRELQPLERFNTMNCFGVNENDNVELISPLYCHLPKKFVITSNKLSEIEIKELVQKIVKNSVSNQKAFIGRLSNSTKDNANNVLAQKFSKLNMPNMLEEIGFRRSTIYNRFDVYKLEGRTYNMLVHPQFIGLEYEDKIDFIFVYESRIGVGKANSLTRYKEVFSYVLKNCRSKKIEPNLFEKIVNTIYKVNYGVYKK